MAKSSAVAAKGGNRMMRELPLYLLVLPAVVIVGIYSYGAMVGIVIAFQKFIPTKGLFGSEWIGFGNFKTLLALPNFGGVIRNTILISVFKIIGGIIVPVSFALLLNEIGNKFFKRILQTMVYLPNFMSWVILSGIFIDILSPSNGIVGKFISFLGFKAPFFIGDPKWFPAAMIFTDIWKGFGFGSVIYLAALTSIDPTLYESAVMDGANRLKQTIHITLPGITSTIILMSVLSMANILNGGFEQIFNMYSPSVYPTGDILDTLVYRLGIQQTKYAVSTAAGLIKSGVSLVFILASYKMADIFAGYRIF
ncbi:MAG: ABC transporter permease subunit [Clostridiales bacterium]|jgi:putative aldouronate transport system permease protein|nr:ABC transporter permease subunit [Clostridiales bacterium]